MRFTLLRNLLAIACLLSLSQFGYTETKTVNSPPIIDMGARFHPQVGRQGMVVAQTLASQVGADILSKGGNAIDAAVATGFALAVTFPQAGNLGGGGFMMIYLAEEQRTIAVDYREMAPAAAGADLFLDADGNVDKAKARFSHAAAGVPGTVAGLAHVLEKYGTMSLKQVLQPAIDLARKGFVVSDALAQSLAWRGEQMRKHPASAEYFFRADGSNLQVGDVLKQADLANTLRLIAREGADAFYKGQIAELIVAEMQRGNGLITLQDLSNYQVIERAAVTGTYRGYTIASMPPPSSGGVHLVQMLNMLESQDLAGMGHNSAEYLHHLIETMRRAYADRSHYLGDPDYVDVPVEQLIDKTYARSQVDGIDKKRASKSADIRPGALLPEESPQTTHYSVWDKHGNVVSNTYTLNFSYGSGIAVAGAGFLLNNEMDDFSAKPGVPNAYGLVGAEANSIAPGKRPLSSMTPTLVFQDGKPIIATGSPGGSTIITVVLQLLLNVIDFDMNIAEATAAPRIHHQWLPDRVMVEEGISPDTAALLEAKGHQLVKSRRVIGRAQSIMAGPGVLFGSADFRWASGRASAAQ